MTTTKLIARLEKHFNSLYDEDVYITDGGTSRIVNHAGRVWKFLVEDDNPDIEKLYYVEEYFCDNELFLTDEERDLKELVNRQIFIELTNDEATD